MALDPSAIRVFVLVGAMCVLALLTFLLKRSAPEPPVEAVEYDREAWGEALRPGERIEAQAAVIEPPSWLNALLSANIGRGHPEPYQLALTSGRALLVARRQAERLCDRDRHPLAEVSIARVEDEGPQYVSLDMRLGGEKRRWVRVPGPFFERLRAAGVRGAPAGR